MYWSKLWLNLADTKITSKSVMIQNLQRMQLEAILHENDILEKEVRKLRISLDDIRSKNTKMIEKITTAKITNEIIPNLVICYEDLTSAQLASIIKEKHNFLDSDSENEDNEVEMNQIVEKRDMLVKTLKSLETEYSQMIENNENEKKELKDFFKNQS